MIKELYIYTNVYPTQTYIDGKFATYDILTPIADGGSASTTVWEDTYNAQTAEEPFYFDLNDAYRVDINDDFNIVRNYVTPYFSDATKIFNNSSYSVKLPLTQKNKSLFGYAEREDTTSNIPYDYVYADYFVNGIQIFRNAEVKVLSVDEENIEVQFVWGIQKSTYSNLISKYMDEIVVNGTTILTADWILNWNRTNEVYNSTKKATWLNYISGERISDIRTVGGVVQPKIVPEEPVLSNLKEMTVHPFVYFKSLMDLINYSNSLSIQFTNSNPNYSLKNKLLNQGIIISKKDAEINKEIAGHIGMPANYTSSAIEMTAYSGDFYKLIELYDNYTLIFDKNSVSGDGQKDVTIYIKLTSTNIIPKLYIQINSNTGSYVNHYEVPYTGYGGNYDYEGTYTLQLSAGYTIMFSHSLQYVTLPGSRTIDISYNLGKSFFNYSPNYGIFDILANLPHITQMDFIKEMLILSGGVISYDNTGKIKFLFLDQFKDNITNGNVYDWTGRISNIKNGLFEFNSNAQKNWIKFNNNADLTGRNEYISVSNNTVEAEKDLYITKFDSGLGVESAESEIVMYKQSVKSGDSGAVEFTNEFDEKYNYPIVYDSSGIAKNHNIIGTNYDIYKKIVNKPTIRTAEINLDFFESANFDYTKPIYVGEWGKYCMLLELNAPENEVCTVKLLLINQTL